MKDHESRRISTRTAKIPALNLKQKKDGIFVEDLGKKVSSEEEKNFEYSNVHTIKIERQKVDTTQRFLQRQSQRKASNQKIIEAVNNPVCLVKKSQIEEKPLQIQNDKISNKYKSSQEITSGLRSR